MLDFAHPPTLLVKHGIVDHAADGQFRIILDGIIFEVFVPAIAVEQVLPIWIALADGAAKAQNHRRRLDIQWFIVLDNSNRFTYIQRRQIHLHGLQKKTQAELLEKLS